MKLSLETHRLLRSLVTIVTLTLFAVFAMPSQSATVSATGTFVGQSDHVTTGSVTIEQDAGKVVLVLGEDFSLDGAPAPTIGFSKDGKFDAKTEFSKLKSKDGGQTYEVPSTIDLSVYDAVTIWCSKFSVPLGSASLTR